MNRRTIRTLTAVVAVGVLVVAAVIMLRGDGLVDGYDFGAGAYYYADIPDFQKIIKDDAYSTSVPGWVFYVLFLLWGGLMYWIWTRIDRKK